jgi:hypothetical protein
MLLYNKVTYKYKLSISLNSSFNTGFTRANCKSYIIIKSIFVRGSKTWVLYSIITSLYSLTSLYFLLKAFTCLFPFLI